MAYAASERFEWDSAKDAANLAKHGISFCEAAKLFSSEVPWLEVDDEEHSGEEPRWRAIGVIARGVAVVVCTERDDDLIRIISARLATPRERRLFKAWIERNR